MLGSKSPSVALATSPTDGHASEPPWSPDDQHITQNAVEHVESMEGENQEEGNEHQNCDPGSCHGNKESDENTHKEDRFDDDHETKSCHEEVEADLKDKSCRHEDEVTHPPQEVENDDDNDDKDDEKVNDGDDDEDDDETQDQNIDGEKENGNEDDVEEDEATPEDDCCHDDTKDDNSGGGIECVFMWYRILELELKLRLVKTLSFTNS